MCGRLLLLLLVLSFSGCDGGGSAGTQESQSNAVPLFDLSSLGTKLEFPPLPEVSPLDDNHELITYRTDRTARRKGIEKGVPSHRADEFLAPSNFCGFSATDSKITLHPYFSIPIPNAKNAFEWNGAIHESSGRSSDAADYAEIKLEVIPRFDKLNPDMDEELFVQKLFHPVHEEVIKNRAITNPKISSITKIAGKADFRLLTASGFRSDVPDQEVHLAQVIALRNTNAIVIWLKATRREQFDKLYEAIRSMKVYSHKANLPPALRQEVLAGFKSTMERLKTLKTARTVDEALPALVETERKLVETDPEMRKHFESVVTSRNDATVQRELDYFWGYRNYTDDLKLDESRGEVYPENLGRGQPLSRKTGWGIHYPSMIEAQLEYNKSHQ